MNLVEPSDPCEQSVPNEVVCFAGPPLGGPGTTGSPGNFEVLLRGGNDAFFAAHKGVIGDFEVHGGKGNDSIWGHNDPIRDCGFCVGPNDCEPAGKEFFGDSLYGGKGRDRMYGGEGPDSLSGGAGPDRMFGDDSVLNDRRDSDTLFSGKGRDFIDAWDGNRDHAIDCGPGRDRVLIDRNKDPEPTHCEVVVRRTGRDP